MEVSSSRVLQSTHVFGSRDMCVLCDVRLQEGGVIESHIASGGGLEHGARHEDAALDPGTLQHLIDAL